MITSAALLVAAALTSFGLGLLWLVELICGARRRGRVERLAVGLALGLGVAPAIWTALKRTISAPCG